MRRRLWTAQVAALLLLSLRFASAAERVSLNGEWAVLRSSGATPSEATGDFQKVTIPGVFDPHDRRFAWCRREFTVPESWRGRHVFLHFGGVRFTPVVYVNGREAGSYWGGWEPFEVEITDLCEVGAGNELLMRISSDVPAFLEAGVPYKPDWGPVQTVQNKVLEPMGFVFTNYAAIWDDVTLLARPDVYVDDVTIVTSVRQASMTATVALRNLGETSQQVRLSARAMDDDETALDLGGEAVGLEPGQAAQVTFARAWPNPRLWEPGSPQLYDLDVRLSADGRELDSARVRFGFREFWTEGAAFMLNGKPVTLLATARPGMSELFSREEVLDTYGKIRSANGNAVRLHSGVWPQVWLDVADEIGMLLVEESSFWCCTDQYAVNDPTFWDNFRKHWQGIVRRGKNHPSVVIYSVENELLLCQHGEGLAELERNLAEIGRCVKQLDPTRPIMFEGDDDPGGVADIVNLHYPHEFPRHFLWPNTAYWLDEPTVVDNYPRRLWHWDRSKPLYMGEFQFTGGGWRGDSLFLGDEAYSRPELRETAQATAWEMQVEAFRTQGVAGICPYTVWQPGFTEPLFGAVQRAFEPNGAILRQYDTRFYSGDEVVRTVNLYNSTMRAAELVLRWELEGGPSGGEAVSLGPGGHAELPVTVAMPSVEEVTSAPFRLTVRSGDEVVYTAERRYWICPRRAPRFELPAGTRVAVLRGDGVAARFLRGGGLRPFTVAAPSLVAASGASLLVVEAHALDRYARKERLPVVGAKSGGPIVEFAEAGGSVIVLEQGAYPSGLIPARLTGKAATMAFVRSAVAGGYVGGREDWFKFWRGDNVVSRNTIRKPSSGAFRVMVDAGGSGGLDQALLVEMPVGKGRMFLCQLALSEKLGDEPAAALVLEGLVNEASRPPVERRPLALLGVGEGVRADLGSLGVVSEELTESLATARLEDYGLVLVAGSLAQASDHAAELRDYVAAGGRVLLHGVPAEEAGQLAGLLGRPVALGATASDEPPVIAAPAPLTDGLANEDLQWQRAAAAVPEADARLDALLRPALLVRATEGAGCWLLDQVGWDGRVADSEQAARYLSVLLTNLEVAFRPAVGRLVMAGSELTVEGGDAYRRGDTVGLRTSGSLSAAFRCASAGDYLLAFAGRTWGGDDGTPNVRLLVDGAPVPEGPAEGGGLPSFRVHLAEGAHKAVLEFTPAPDAPAGRGGLWVTGLRVQPD